MAGVDEEFEDFLKRRKAVFERRKDDLFEPPADLDRIVLRQAREAIEPEEPMRVFSAPRWTMPIALAATLVLAFTIIFQAGMPQKQDPKPEVTVENVAERVGSAAAGSSGQPAGELPAEAAAPAMARSAVVEAASRERVAAGTSMDAAPAAPPPAPPADAPAWRRDAKSWLAEIERLRNAGDAARADAEFAEYKRQQRAYAVAPDR